LQNIIVRVRFANFTKQIESNGYQCYNQKIR